MLSFYPFLLRLLVQLEAQSFPKSRKSKKMSGRGSERPLNCERVQEACRRSSTSSLKPFFRLSHHHAPLPFVDNQQLFRSRKGKLARGRGGQRASARGVEARPNKRERASEREKGMNRRKMSSRNSIFFLFLLLFWFDIHRARERSRF